MTDLLESRTRLKRLKVYAVGLVDSPAIRRKFLILKRNAPPKKALTEAKFPTIQRPAQGTWKYCVCSKCGHSQEHEARKACGQLKCPKCGTKMVGSNTQQLKKQGGETKVKPNIKDAVVQAQKEVLEKLDKGEEVVVKEKVGDPPEVEEVEEIIEEEETEEERIEKEIEESAKDLDPQEKSAYSAFVGKCMKAGKTLKECALEWKTDKEAKAKKEDAVAKAKVKVSIETEEKEQKGDGEPKVAGTFAGAFDKVFSVFDRNIGAAKKDEEKRQWRALKALLSKTIGALPVQKSEDFESLQAGLDAVTGEVDTLLKADPAVSAEGFKPVLLALDKLIGTAEGGVKTALEKTKLMLSKLVGGIQPSPATKGVVEVTQPEELALLSLQVEELTGKIDKLAKGQADHQAMLDKIPVQKGHVKKEKPREQGGDSEDLLEKHKGETAPQRMRSVLKELAGEGES